MTTWTRVFNVIENLKENDEMGLPGSARRTHVDVGVDTQFH